MNTLYEHHKSSIKFAYRCFDRILLNGLIQPFQQPERVIGFFNAYRDGERVTRNLLRKYRPSNFRTGSRTVARNGVRPSWMHPTGRRDESRPRPTRWWRLSEPWNRPGS